MQFSSGAKFLLAGLLGLSLAGKLAASRPDPAVPEAISAVHRLLSSSGFRSHVVDRSRSPRRIVSASRGACRLILGEYPPHSEMKDVYAALAKPVGPLRFVYRGGVYEAEPKMRSLFEQFLWREMGRVGIAAPRAPVLAFAASASCDIEKIDWHEVATVV